ncbi:guanylate kinase [Opisthorchis viverrini]|uniref:Guanylate kinase n=1 Tax=Opisthorchis viverrini TaxID=6198 RepID=A0A1S8X321_OPIVI|nr:guanylate kinase [Opisthorchis viverrini]
MDYYLFVTTISSVQYTHCAMYCSNILPTVNDTTISSRPTDTTKERDPDEDDETEFVVDSHANMEKAHYENKFLEFGEFEGHYYGTKLDSIREVINSGRTCLLACSIQAVPRIRNSEFMPYVVLLAAPSVSCMKAMYEYGMSMGFTHKWKRHIKSAKIDL